MEREKVAAIATAAIATAAIATRHSHRWEKKRCIPIADVGKKVQNRATSPRTC